MNDSQIGIALAAAGILVVAVALHRQGALPRVALIAAAGAALGLAGFLIATL